jgi:hypothetical protein
MDPNWIGAIAAIWLAVVTTWTLVILRRYAADTKTIAKASVEQIENSQMPFVGLVMTTGESSRIAPWAIRNQGSGVALNIYFSRLVNENVTMQWMTPLAPGEECPLEREVGVILGAESGFVVEYQSLAGRKYRTTTRRVENQLKVTFGEIE